MSSIVSTRITRLQNLTPRTTGVLDISGVVVSLTATSVVLPANPDGTIISYAAAETTIRVYHGGVDKTTDWTFSKIDSTGIVSSLVGTTLSITSLTSDFAYVTITATRIGYANQTVIFSVARAKSGANGTNGVNGTNGIRGVLNLAAATAGTSWSDSVANAAISASGYGVPIERDVVTLYNTALAFSETRLYSSGVWTAVTAYINGTMVISGTFSADKITTGTLTGVLIRTAPSGTRVIINEGSANSLRAYLNSTLVAEIGGTGSVWAKSISPGQASIIGESISTGAGVKGTTNSSGGAGVLAETSAGSSPALVARITGSGTGPAIQSAGNVIPEGLNRLLGTSSDYWSEVHANRFYGTLIGASSSCSGNAATCTYASGVRIGPTSSRPSASDGLLYYDTTVGGLCFANGSNWYKAIGTPL